MKNITVAIDGANYTIPPEGYLIPDVKEQACVLGIGSQNVLFGVILGTTFMRNFFTALDYQNNAISLAKSAGKPYINKETPDSSGLSEVEWIFVIGGSLILAACLINLIYLCCCKGRFC